MKIFNKKILNKAATFLLTAVLLCWNALQVRAADYTPVVSEGRFSVPLLVNREEFIDAGYYRDSYIVTETFSITGLPWNSTIRGNVGILRQTNCHIYDFINSVEGNHYIHVQGSVESIQTNNSNGEFISYYSGNELCNFRADNFGETFDNHDNNWYTIAYADYFAGSSDVQVSVTYYVTVFSTAKSYKIEFLNNWVILDFSTVTVENGNTINSADIANQNYLQQIYQSTSNIETLQQQGNQLQQEQMDQSQQQHNELINGYEDTTLNDANDGFLSSSSELTALEGELSTQSNTYVTDYAAEGFDLGVLATIGSSLIFVTTWFTNFWNMGGVFTACLNFCFALSIVFFILRMKR